jgi:uncharacterized protein (DUF924 family)
MTPADVIGFWLHDVGEKDWYSGGPALDARIRDRMGEAVADAREGRLEHWRDGPEGVLAYLLLTDQMTRNVHRDTALAFASDWRARGAAGEALALDWDLMVGVPLRQFFYLPFMHAEDLARQDLCIRCFATRYPNPSNHLHARTHRDIIRRFGRFPFRNAALGRQTTPEEQAFLDAGGYGTAVRAMIQTHGPIPER